MVQKVVYNNCFGGWGLKEEVIEWVRDNEQSLKEQYSEEDVEELVDQTLSGEQYPDGSTSRLSRTYIHDTYLTRDNEVLVDIVSGNTEYDGPVDGSHSELEVAEIPDGVSWTIDEYDGIETVRESARTFS